MNIEMTERIHFKFNRFFKFIFLFVMFLAFSTITFSSFAYAQGVAVIVNPSAPSLSKEDIKAIFLGFKKILPDGTYAQPIMLKGNGAKEKFLKNVLGIDEREYKSHWLQKAFAGEGAPPKELTPEEIIAIVKTQKGAVGVVPYDKVVEGVKVVLEIK